ncbi:MAG: winged helix-turn-helix domain-containing protein [Pyrinomonadaceae bacterium]
MNRNTVVPALKMIPVIKTEAARLLLLDAQGLLSDASRPATPATLHELIERMGFVQLDSINIVERAHHLTLASRLDGYRQEHLTQLLEAERSLFEHWTHDASVIPVKWFAHWKPRFARDREHMRHNRWWMQRMGEQPDKVIALVRERIAREGPLRSQDFAHERSGESSAWWGWKPQKAALEYLWSTGELMVTRRQKFQKVYDLTERVFPDEHRAAPPSQPEHVEWACRTALERLVVATPKEVAEFWNAIEIAQAKAWCEEAARAGRITPSIVEPHGEGAELAKPKQSYALVDWEQRLHSLRAPPDQMRLLSPFDPVLRDRARALRLFGYDYRFEAFVPESRRQYGYYVLPVLEGDRLVGRIDPKFHRDEKVLRIKRVFWEPGVRVTRLRRRRLEAAAARLARFISAERVEWPKDDGRVSFAATQESVRSES